jgi:hypothetical protein
MSTYGGFPPPNDDSRESVAERERNAAHPRLLRIATFCLALSGAFFVISFMVSFVMFMNSRESNIRESTGSYHATTFRVLEAYGLDRNPLGAQKRGVQSMPFARGVVEGKEERMDLGTYLGVVPKGVNAVAGAVPPGTVIPVFYNPSATGSYRVLLLGSVPPAEANSRRMAASTKYGLMAMTVTGLMLLGFLRLRKMCF